MNIQPPHDEAAASGSDALAPRRSLRVRDGVAVVVGTVIGSGIFLMPSLVAANTPNGIAMLGVWVLGALIAMAGAFCYAELAAAYPDAGGDYFFLNRAYGPEIGLLFGWARMTVIQTGAIAAAAFIAGSYLSTIAPLGRWSSALYAASIVIALTGLNLAGLRFGKTAQMILAAAVTIGLLLVAVAGFWPSTGGLLPTPPANPGPADFGAIGLAMIFVLYSFGGWNEAAYLSAEMGGSRRSIASALLIGVGLVAVVYLVVNAAFLNGLGHAGMAASEAVAVDLLRGTLGEASAVALGLLVVIAVLGTVNASILTGARSNYAVGRDFPRLFGWLGGWKVETAVPASALVVQAGITLVLIGGSQAFGDGGGGVESMVAYTAPAFWFFFFLSGLAVMVLRVWDGGRPRPFRVPLYPLVPFVFCLVCLWMLCSAVAYAGIGSFVGVAALLAGVPLVWLSGDRRRSKNDSQKTS